MIVRPKSKYIYNVNVFLILGNTVSALEHIYLLKKNHEIEVFDFSTEFSGGMKEVGYIAQSNTLHYDNCSVPPPTLPASQLSL